MTSAHVQPVKVLYIVGSGRSGTTILANLLGQLGGFVSAGELFMMWESALKRPNACGCRRYVPDCPFWKEVFEHAFGGMDRIDIERMYRALSRHFRTRHYMLRGELDISRANDWDFLRSNLARLYSGIARVSGSRVIIDASKRPVYALLLGLIPEIELYVVHMVRDPRAVAFSWWRKKVQPVTGQLAKQFGPIRSSLMWSGLNLVAERAFERERRIGLFQRIRYEDFVARPRAELQAILGTLRESTAGDPFTSDRTALIGVSHTMAGNRSRFAKGLVDIAPDREWEELMSPGRKLLVSALTWPLLPRYHYPLIHVSAGK